MGKIASIKQALWNPQTKTCLGRTGDSWLKIIGFYVCLYSCLAAIWSMYYGIFHLTISDKYPKWTLGESIIGTNPGVGMRPHSPRERVESALIHYREGSNGDFQHWVENISGYLSELSGETAANNSNSQTIKINCNEKKSDEEARETICPFDSSAIPADCKAAQNYSFPLGQPCILIKLNRIYGWKPEPHDWRPATYPEEAPFEPAKIQITCEGQHDPDKEHLGPVEYFPSNGIDVKYYPFFNQPGYQSPYVMVHFKNPKRNTLIYIECKAWAKNVEHDRYNRKGLTMFELFIESAEEKRGADQRR
jgi:sodium/potassium-transporting ATPase subunit beta